MENWKISRAGVINFWYYDEETFHFEEGRLLLRGANGSGKSVTMQSLVPLLFDGNKSPERLDPFGSKARKMESYLLSDGLDLEERTGYLFLEFEKAASKRYMTIGMGMRARKNMPMQTWYFILYDNRRIGHEHELSLYKDLGDKLPLTQKELENRIGQGGQVYTKQSEYKAAVNDHLFGYTDVSDFDELITLLIQIRSPKLSKEFKPTTMYEIMQNSLVTLSDEDLRPMSEAIENMDEIKLKIDALNASKRAIARIQTAYDKYNAYMLTTKAKRLLQYHHEVQHLGKKQAKLTSESAAHKARLETIATNIIENDAETVHLKQKEESLKAHDLTKLAVEAQQLDRELLDLNKSAENKQKQLITEEQGERALEIELKEKTDGFERAQRAIADKFKEMDEEAGLAGFEEHAFFTSEYANAADNFNFVHHREMTKRYHQQVQTAKKALEEQVKITRQYDEALAKVDDVMRRLDKQERLTQETQRQFNQIKEEFAEKAFSWSESTQSFKVNRSVLQQVTERIFSYGETYGFEDAILPLRDVYEQLKQDEYVQIHKIKGEKAIKKEHLESLENEYKALDAQKEPEPRRTPAVIANRENLLAKNIPFLPLYKAIDFSKELDDSRKGHIEEALEAMGLLDALLISPAHQDIIEKMDPRHADKYIFAEPEFLSHNLSQLLSPEAASSEGAFTKNQIEDVLMSILLNDAQKRFYIAENGTYGMGIIKGKTSGQTKSRYIGAASRKRYKQELLASIQVDISDVKDVLESLESRILAHENTLRALQEDWSLFPKNQDLEVAYKEHYASVQMLSVIKNEESASREASESVYEKLKAAKQDVLEKTQKLYLTLSYDVFDEADKALYQYQQMLVEIIQLDQEKSHANESITSLNRQLEACLERLDDLRYELTQIDRKMSHCKARRHDIEAQLAVSDFEDIRRQIEACHDRLAELPNIYKDLVNEQAALMADCKRITHEESKIKEDQNRANAQMHLYQQAFEQEYLLGYCMQVQETSDAELTTTAQKALSSYGAILEEGKTVVELTDALKERFIRETGELAEYHLKAVTLFGDLSSPAVSEDDTNHIQRTDLVGKVQGKSMKFNRLSQWIEEQIMEQSSLLSEQDRKLFEEILINSVSRKINAKIYHSEKWVKKIDELMNSMDTSSGLSFHLKWVTKEAEREDQLSTKELVSLLKGDQALLTREQKDRLIGHFQSKIAESKIRLEDTSDMRSFLAIMKEILDYRKWFQFQLFYTKKGDKRKELTNNAFFTFSGGEKAMAMYVPLFSAVYAKYSGANSDCPKVVSLDEAFAGVDEKNITDMFRLLVKELDLNFIANSQVLYGDYETVPSLSIYELIRPENVTFVTSIRYLWNGKERVLVSDSEALDGDDS